MGRIGGIMPECLILHETIDEEECRSICTEAVKDGKTKVMIPKKVKRIIGWKGICKSCRHHKKAGS